MTDRLYYADSYLTDFAARVLRTEALEDGRRAVVLDCTAFYPTGGGQPFDLGTIDNHQLVGCETNEQGEVLHILNAAPPAVGSEVAGRIDVARRLDHIQQHTAQHILSRAFINLYDATTDGFRISDDYAEIDIRLAEPIDDRLRAALALANRIVRENRFVRVNYMTPEQASARAVRQRFEREGMLRVIEIEDFDLNPCGGTHARHTGEVGVILIPSWERAKGMTRLRFVAGERALREYERANDTARRVALLLSVGRKEAAAAIERMLEENRSLARRLRELEEAATRHEAREIVETTEPDADNTRIITRRFPDRDAESLKRLAAELIKHSNTIALLSSIDGEAARLVFARSADAPGDMNRLMREACAAIDGRGGGRPDMAQGGGTRPDLLPAALDAARRNALHAPPD